MFKLRPTRHAAIGTVAAFTLAAPGAALAHDGHRGDAKDDRTSVHSDKHRHGKQGHRGKARTHANKHWRKHRHDRRGHRHHRPVALTGNVTAVDAAARTVTLTVTKASRGGRSLTGETVTVAVKRAKTADTDGDGRMTLADVTAGDEVLAVVQRKRARAARSTDGDATLVAHMLVNRTNPPDRRAKDDDRCDHRYKDRDRD
jgi:hypothetical protein